MNAGQTLHKTPLHDWHAALGAKLVPFAGYAMPVHYPLGILKEHLHTRSQAGLFDVSHMGQAFLLGKTGEDVAKVFQRLVPGNVSGLKPSRQRYTLLLNDQGGIRDDLMVTRFEGRPNTLYLVVNAACKEADFKYISEALSADAALEILADRALLALQGPAAERVLSKLWPGAAELAFMQSAQAKIVGFDCFISRSGYTGEDGFEISIPAEGAVVLADALCQGPEVEPIGLGARDSLRLEAGLCLYGHDLDETTSPVEANLVWALGKARREAGDFPGATRILKELKEGPARLRVGIQPLTRAPAREGTEVLSETGEKVGTITSGGFGPTAGGPVAMGYLATSYVKTGAKLGLNVRGQTLPAVVAELPFVPHRYKRA
jgi:glycine cleavage system T protein (aminomethyltransferase)